jgi:hypothetical protein
MDLDFGEFFRRITTAPGTGGLEAQALMRQGVADQAAAEALAAQRDARRRAELAAIPAADKESTRLASEAHLRKLLRASGFNFSGSPLGPAALGFSTLMGE